MIEGARIRTHSKNPAVRLLYFAYLVAVSNAWVVANAILGHITGIHAEKESLISQRHFKNMMLHPVSLTVGCCQNPRHRRLSEYICED